MPTRIAFVRWSLAPLALVLAGCAASYEGGGSVSSTEAGRAGYVRDVGADEFYDLLLARPDAFVLDVRGPAEWDDELGHLERAVQIPVQELPLRWDELPEDRRRPILVYGRSGVRSVQAAQTLAGRGYEEVIHLTGGLAAYREAGYTN